MAVEAARAAGSILREGRGQVRQIRHKSAIDLVTDVDVRCEQAIRAAILSAFPDHSILGEEGGSVGGTASGLRWIVDPLDGTTNYAHGFPFFCVSIGLEVHGQLTIGVVYDPSLDELFVARHDGGATLNGVPLRCSVIDDLQQSLLATGFPYDRARFPRALRGFEVASRYAQAVRRAGSAALDLCYVACGRLEGYWEYEVSAWDSAAGALLVQEAGGRVTRVDGAPFEVDRGDVLSSNGLIHDALISRLGEVDRT